MMLRAEFFLESARKSKFIFLMYVRVTQLLRLISSKIVLQLKTYTKGASQASLDSSFAIRWFVHIENNGTQLTLNNPASWNFSRYAGIITVVL